MTHTHGPPPDPDLVPGMAHDRSTLEAFYTAYYADVVRYLARRIADPHDVADLVADTFLAAMDSAARYDPGRGRPLAWLLGIAHNTLRHHHRRRAADRQAVAKFSGRRLLDDEDVVRLEETIDAERRARRAYGLLDALSATDRELVELVDVNGLTPQEAGRALGLLPGTTRVRLFRARARLRAALSPQKEFS